MEGKHLVVLYKISFGNRTVATHALIDCGATGIAFIDKDFARHHQLPLTPLQYPRSLEVIDDRPISSGDITHVANTHLAILEHQETLPMFVTKLGHYPVVLGIPWLELHDVAIRFSSRFLTFGSQYCTLHCNQAPTVVHAHSLASKIAHEEPVDYNLGMGARSSNWRARLNETSAGSTFTTLPTLERPIQISAIGGHPFGRLAYKQKLTIFSTSLYEINQALGLGEQAKKPKELDLKDYVPAEYHEFLPLFS